MHKKEKETDAEEKKALNHQNETISVNLAKIKRTTQQILPFSAPFHSLSSLIFSSKAGVLIQSSF